MARDGFDSDDQDECECPDCAREAGRRFGCPQLTCEDCARAGCSSAEAQCGTTGAGEQANLVPDGGREDVVREDGRAIEQLPEDVDEFNERVTESVREWVLDQRPDKETRKELLSEHAHHLVRDTESAYSRDHDSPDGVKSTRPPTSKTPTVSRAKSGSAYRASTSAGHRVRGPKPTISAGRPRTFGKPGRRSATSSVTSRSTPY